MDKAWNQRQDLSQRYTETCNNAFRSAQDYVYQSYFLLFNARRLLNSPEYALDFGEALEIRPDQLFLQSIWLSFTCILRFSHESEGTWRFQHKETNFGTTWREF